MALTVPSRHVFIDQQEKSSPFSSEERILCVKSFKTSGFTPCGIIQLGLWKVWLMVWMFPPQHEQDHTLDDVCVHFSSHEIQHRGFHFTL